MSGKCRREACCDCECECAPEERERGWCWLWLWLWSGEANAAPAALAAGGEAIGIIPESLQNAEIGHKGLTRLEVVDGMHARKARMAELSDAFIALPGGLGTLEEMFEVWTWGQLGYHAKPLGLMDVNGFYSKLTDFLDHVASEGFVREQHRGMLQISESPSELLDALEAWKPLAAPKWADQKPT